MTPTDPTAPPLPDRAALIALAQSVFEVYWNAVTDATFPADPADIRRRDEVDGRLAAIGEDIYRQVVPAGHTVVRTEGSE